jgi:hypothetical protein
VNAIERLEAAIERLEALRAESTPAPWAATRHGVETVPEFDLHRFDDMPETIARTELLRADADLIVTLHRTINAQLAILRREVSRLTRTVTWDSGSIPEPLIGREISAEDDSILRWFDGLPPEEQAKHRPAADAEIVALTDAILGGA